MILTFNGKFMSRGLNKVLGYESTPPTPDPYNPLNLPANTVRVRTSDGNAPTKGSQTTYETATLVSGTSDVYDVYKSGTSLSGLLYYSRNVIEVLGANTTGITNMSNMFNECNSLTTVAIFDTSSVTNMSNMFHGTALTAVPLFDTSKVTNMANMFQFTALTTVPLFDTSKVTNMSFMFCNCSSLTNVPLFDTSKVTDMSFMIGYCESFTAVPLFDTSSVTNMSNAFAGCTNVSSGALALYQQASTQAVPPSSHDGTFEVCGISTTTGAAELAQIPSSWGGQGS